MQVPTAPASQAYYRLALQKPQTKRSFTGLGPKTGTARASLPAKAEVLENCYIQVGDNLSREPGSLSQRPACCSSEPVLFYRGGEKEEKR